MNIFKKLVISVAFYLTATNMLCWDGELIQITKDNKSVAFMIRYYSEHEQDAYTQLHHEGFKFAGNHLGFHADGEVLSICGPAHHFFVQDGTAIYEQWKKLINAPQVDSFNDLFNLHNQWLGCGYKHPQVDKSFGCSQVVLLANIAEKEKWSKVVNTYKSAMRKIAKEDVGITIQKTSYENGNVVEWVKWRHHFNGGVSMNAFNIKIEQKPETNLWTKLKSFVWNEKFLYAMSALSALYLGYEYLKQ